jgi:competence protein ComEC
VPVPAAIVALPLVVGALTGLVISDRSVLPIAFYAASAATIALLSAAAALSVESSAEAVAAIAIGSSLAGLSLGVTSAHRSYHPSLLQWFEAQDSRDASAPIRLEGVLREDASLSGPLPSLVVDVQRITMTTRDGRPSIHAEGGVRLSIGGAFGPARLAEWRAGRRVRISALLRLPSTYLDPGVRDDRRALARRGIVLVGTAKSAAMVEVLARGSRSDEAAAGVRSWVRARLADGIGRWSAKSAGVAIAVLIGDRTGLPDADTRRLQDAGTYHVIAISGGNIAILTVLVISVLGGLRVPARSAAATTIVLLLVYREIVVSAPSVERAISAALLYLAARVLDHRGSALNVLAVAATLGTAIAPVVLLDPGFVLSFGATLGILVVASAGRGPAGRTSGIAQRAGRSLWALLWTTVAAEAALLPVAAAFFGRITMAGVVLNFAAIPLMSLLQAASLATLVVSVVSGSLTGFVGCVAHLAAAGIIESARLTEIVPGLARDVVTPGVWVVLLYYVAGILVLAKRRPRVTYVARAAFVGAAGVIVAGPGWSARERLPSPTGLRVAFLDVGQGDSTVVILPGGSALLVDAGGVPTAQSPESSDSDTGPFDVGRRVVAPALRALGVRHLDVLAITHGDPDHIGGAPAILRTLSPSTVWEGVPVPPHPWLRNLNQLADAMAVRWRTVQAGDEERIGGVKICVLHPPLPDWERQRVRNEDSIVLDVRIGDVSIVLPGDIGREGERASLKYLQPARIVVLKAPHHGSATSSTQDFLTALRPAAVIFSAGRSNRFGHPHPAVVARYRDLGGAMFSTAEDGAVILDTDGKSVTVTGWTGRRVELKPKT